jgi:RNA polymerase sigma-70 factor (family 1)
MENWFQESDRNLLNAIAQGNESAFHALFRRYYKSLVGYIYRFTKDAEMARDLSQEIMILLWQKRNQLDRVELFERYLWRMGRNSAINALKKKDILLFGIADALENTEGESTEEPLFDFHEEVDDTTRLNQALSQLPEKCRIIFEMSRFDQLSHKQIAEELGISTKTIENQITKAFKVLRSALTNNTTPLLALLTFLF